MKKNGTKIDIKNLEILNTWQIIEKFADELIESLREQKELDIDRMMDVSSIILNTIRERDIHSMEACAILLQLVNALYQADKIENQCLKNEYLN